MTTRLVLVRHGQTALNVAGRTAGWTDTPLSETGTQQAHLVADAVAARYSPSAIVSSPLRRALVTAQIIGQHVDLEPETHEGLRELNFGAKEELTQAETQALLPDAWLASLDEDNLDFAWPGGETRRQFFTRVLGAIDEIAERFGGSTVAVVAHGGVIGTYLALLLEGKPHLWRGHIVRNCSISEVAIEDGVAQVVVANDASHLPDAGPDALAAELARSAG